MDICYCTSGDLFFSGKIAGQTQVDLSGNAAFNEVISKSLSNSVTVPIMKQMPVANPNNIIHFYQFHYETEQNTIGFGPGKFKYMVKFKGNSGIKFKYVPLLYLMDHVNGLVQLTSLTTPVVDYTQPGSTFDNSSVRYEAITYTPTANTFPSSTTNLSQKQMIFSLNFINDVGYNTEGEVTVLHFQIPIS